MPELAGGAAPAVGVLGVVLFGGDLVSGLFGVRAGGFEVGVGGLAVSGGVDEDSASAAAHASGAVAAVRFGAAVAGSLPGSG